MLSVALFHDALFIPSLQNKMALGMRRMWDLRRHLFVFCFSPVGDAFLKVRHVHVKMSLLALSSMIKALGESMSYSNLKH